MISIWHNPRCSKSRETLALLRAHGVEPEIRLYLDQPPNPDELRSALARLGQPAAALARCKDADFVSLGLRPDMPEAALLAALSAHPHLIERPLVLTPDKAALGRPPEAVLSLL